MSFILFLEKPCFVLDFGLFMPMSCFWNSGLFYIYSEIWNFFFR